MYICILIIIQIQLKFILVPFVGVVGNDTFFKLALFFKYLTSVTNNLKQLANTYREAIISNE